MVNGDCFIAHHKPRVRHTANIFYQLLSPSLNNVKPKNKTKYKKKINNAKKNNCS